MIRAIHVISGIANIASGPSYSVVQLCKSLMANGVKSDLHVLGNVPENVPENIRIYAHPRWRFPLKLGISPDMEHSLIRSAMHAEIMHSHNLWMMPNIYAGRAVRGSSCRTVISPRGTMSDWAWNWHHGRKRVIGWWGQFKVLREASCFHATSKEEVADIRRRGFGQPVAMIPNGVDIPELPQKQVTGTTRCLLYVGRVHPVKGLPNLLRAWASVTREFPDWVLKIVGPDSEGHLDELLRLSEELKCQRVSFERPLFGNDLRQAYQDADLYVLPTHSENFGMTIAEALANGTPVITTKGAPWSGLKRESCGWWIDVGAQPLEQCLREAMKTSRLELRSMGERGRAWMGRDFGWQALGLKMKLTYEWLINGGTEPDWVTVR